MAKYEKYTFTKTTVSNSQLLCMVGKISIKWMKQNTKINKLNIWENIGEKPEMSIRLVPKRVFNNYVQQNFKL